MEDRESFEAPSDGLAVRTNHVDSQTCTQLAHMFVYDCFDLVLDTKAEREQVENSRLGLDISATGTLGSASRERESAYLSTPLHTCLK
jgi:hypothetical protein